MARTDEDRSWIKSELVESVLLLAATYADQVAALPRGVAIADEVALIFDDAYGAVDRSALPTGVDQLLEEISAQLDAMSDDPVADHWTTASLARSDSWERLRALASEALVAWGYERRAPAIAHRHYVPSRKG